jgi:hypothetical protein
LVEQTVAGTPTLPVDGIIDQLHGKSRVDSPALFEIHPVQAFIFFPIMLKAFVSLHPGG